MPSTKMYDQFKDFFFDIIVTNDKWSWSIYFEFTLASSLVPKNWVYCRGDNVRVLNTQKLKKNEKWKIFETTENYMLSH